MKKNSNKDYIEVQKIEPTYFDGRDCDHCSKPIADQEHATRRFCEKTKDIYGNVIDCKSDFHRDKEAPDKAIQVEIINNHKALARRITELLSKKSPIVTTQDLDAYDIDLQHSLEYFIKPNGELTSIFLVHTIITNPLTKTHKIVTNDK